MTPCYSEEAIVFVSIGRFMAPARYVYALLNDGAFFDWPLSNRDGPISALAPQCHPWTPIAGSEITTS
jgi:hypothetical protein